MVLKTQLGLISIRTEERGVGAFSHGDLESRKEKRQLKFLGLFLVLLLRQRVSTRHRVKDGFLTRDQRTCMVRSNVEAHALRPLMVGPIIWLKLQSMFCIILHIFLSSIAYFIFIICCLLMPLCFHEITGKIRKKKGQRTGKLVIKIILVKFVLMS